MLRPLLPVLYKLAKIYWFIFRPVTTGTKIVLVSGDQILLIKNTYGKDAWTLVGGGLKKGESPEEAVIREVNEEVGLRVAEAKLLGSFQTREEFKKDTVWVFMSQLDDKILDLDPVEIKRARWFKITNLPPITSSITKKCLTLSGISIFNW